MKKKVQTGGKTARVKASKVVKPANKRDLIDAVAAELNLPVRTAARVLETALSAVTKLLQTSRRVVVHDFGSFHVQTRRARRFTHPTTGKSVVAPASETVVFRAAPGLKNLFKQK